MGRCPMWFSVTLKMFGCGDRRQPLMSALPPKADKEQTCRNVRFVRQKRTYAVQQNLLMMFQRRLSCVGRLAATASFGASTILGSRIVKVEPRPGSHPGSC